MRLFYKPSRVNGFSVVELLVVIVVLALLVALTLPAIAKSRSAARSAQSLANARTLTQTLHLYADMNRDYLPALSDGVFYPGYNRETMFSFPYWQVADAWTGVVFDLLPYNENVSVYLSPGSPRRHEGNVWPTSYHYSRSFVADPQTWVPGATPDPRWMTPRRLSATRFPSQKAMLWDGEAGFIPRPRRSETGDLMESTPIAMADVSAFLRRPSEASIPVPNPFPAPGALLRLHNTLLGQEGTDY